MDSLHVDVTYLTCSPKICGLIQNYYIASEDLKYNAEVVWGMIILYGVILERDSPDPHANELYIDFWVCCAFKNIDLQPTIYIIRPE